MSNKPNDNITHCIDCGDELKSTSYGGLCYHCMRAEQSLENYYREINEEEFDKNESDDIL